jgi:cell wall-associated NlpC family hydrolase
MAEVVKIENSEENEDVLKNAQLGDMIEFTRGVYSHWAIYVGKLSLYLYIFVL